MRNRLKLLRVERGWTQEQLGHALGVSRQAVNALETEKHDPSLDLAYRIAVERGIAGGRLQLNGGSGRRVAWLAARRQPVPAFTYTWIQRKSWVRFSVRLRIGLLPVTMAVCPP